MRRLLPVWLVALGLVTCQTRGSDADAANADVLRIAQSFTNGGGYNTAWKGSGTPAAITFQGENILAAGEGTYCCGFTFTVAMQAAVERGLLGEKTTAQIRQFQKEWYGATDQSRERLCATAMTTVGIGQAISFEEAKPGDFVQFWRAKSGHSVLFLSWVEEKGEKVGLRYRSSQSATDGIGDRVEYFIKTATTQNPINKERTYFCRLNPR
ncbi:MAG: hypothetical protein JWR69_3455 [Pedosphaera sp.]|nr:hypothetical protein [Pedosphaera sp.]